MNIKIEQILDSQKSLTKLNESKLPVKVSYWISRLIAVIKSPLETYSEERNKILEKYGVRKEGTNEFNIPKENTKEYFEELKKLTDIEVDIPINKIKISDLGNIEVEPVLLLDWLFEGE